MIRAASVGLGWWGKTLANSIQNSNKINVVMATTKTLNNIEDYCKDINAEVANSYDDVVKSDKVDAVILATPHSKHLEQIVQAVNNGKHVFCEKPITLTASDAKIAYDEAKKNNIDLPITKIVDQFYKKIQENGGNRLDTSSLMTLVDK